MEWIVLIETRPGLKKKKQILAKVGVNTRFTAERSETRHGRFRTDL